MKLSKTLTIAILILIFGGASFWLLKKPNNQPQQQDSQEQIRQRDISKIKDFSENQDIKVEYVSAGKSAYNENVQESLYYAGPDQYEIDSSNGKIIQFGTRSLPVGSENEKTYDNSPRYNAQELETMAKQFIAKNAPEVNLEKLSANNSNKETNYFFRWEDKSNKTTEGYPFIQVGFSHGGTLLSYTNTLK